MNKKFRPQHFSGIFVLKNNPVGSYHWTQRQHIPNHIQRVSAHLHYLGCHAPLPVQKQWYRIWQKFERKYHKII